MMAVAVVVDEKMIFLSVECEASFGRAVGGAADGGAEACAPGIHVALHIVKALHNIKTCLLVFQADQGSAEVCHLHHCLFIFEGP